MGELTHFGGGEIMKKLLLSAVGICFLSATPLFAADRPIYKAPPPPPIFNWSGFYVGFDAGWIGADATIFVPGGPATSRPDPDGFIAGGHIGYRYHYPSNIVLGLEADIYGIAGGRGQAIYPGFANTAILDLNWGGSVRVSLGVASGPGLFYVTGGGAWIGFDGCTTAAGFGTPCAAAASFDDTRWGWTVGGGLAYALSANLIVRIEYLYADFGNVRYATPGLVGGVTDVDIVTHTVRGGVSWRFAGSLIAARAVGCKSPGPLARGFRFLRLLFRR